MDQITKWKDWQKDRRCLAGFLSVSEVVSWDLLSCGYNPNALNVVARNACFFSFNASGRNAETIKKAVEKARSTNFFLGMEPNWLDVDEIVCWTGQSELSPNVF